MRILVVGPQENNSTDGVIIKGIKFLLNAAYKIEQLDYYELRDTVIQDPVTSFYSFNQYDLVVVAGTPWLWDSFQKSVKYQNLINCFKIHNQAKKLFLGIGSCLTFDMVGTNILRRPEEQDGMRRLFRGHTVIVRDDLAYMKLQYAGVDCASLPCPAYFCYSGHKEILERQDTADTNVIVFQDPRKSISAVDWQDSGKLDAVFAKYREFYTKHYPKEVYVASAADIPGALEAGLPTPKVLKTADDTLNLMAGAKKVLSGRVHCAVPAIVSGADVELIPLDTRSLVVTARPQPLNLLSYFSEYMAILSQLTLESK